MQKSIFPFLFIIIISTILFQGCFKNSPVDNYISISRYLGEKPIPWSSVKEFYNTVMAANKILYIGDNAGECFFDSLLLDYLPLEKIKFVVRGAPIINDATMEDALAAGINKKCPVITTGDNAPGILLDRCSVEFREAFEKSDLIISKGQGNYESLSDYDDKTIIFLTKVKCDVIATDIGFPLGSNVLKICGSKILK